MIKSKYKFKKKLFEEIPDDKNSHFAIGFVYGIIFLDIEFLQVYHLEFSHLN